MNINEEIDRLINEGMTYSFSNNSEVTDIGEYSKATTDFLSWISSVEHYIITNYSKESSVYELFKSADVSYFTGYEKYHFDEPYNKIMASLKTCKKIKPIQKIEKDKIDMLLNIFNNFHLVVKQLRNRHDSRDTLDVSDEYDVQDLLHSLMRLFFNDIRAEEWAPSYAGGASRMDFLLKEEKIVIEVKKTRKGLDDKELGKQLIEDKAKYKVHPDCKILFCFTYDPDGRITNPKGLENDLNENEEDFQVKVIIKP